MKNIWKCRSLFTIFLSLALSSNATAETTLLGYFDTEFKVSDLDGDSGDFNHQHLSIILQHEADIFKFFAEVEFENGPEIEDEQDGNGTIGKGAVAVERAWSEAHYSPYFNIRMGKILTPTLWQVNHYPNITVSVSRPKMVENIFKDNLVGLLIYGNIDNFSYSIWNMKGDDDVTTDANGHATATARSSFSTGGKIGYNLNWSEGYAAIGILGARYSDPTSSNPIGAEIDLSHSGLNLWAEYAGDDIRSGYYSLLSYDFNFGKESSVSPFVLYDNFKEKIKVDGEERIGFGLNYKPLIGVVAKIEFLKALKANGNPEINEFNFAFVYFFN